MNNQWVRNEQQQIFIRSHLGMTRWVGLIPLGIGGYFLYKYLILGIVEYIQAGDWRGLFTGVFGWLVIVLLGLVFVIPGWIILALRRNTLIDAQRGEVVEVQDVRVYKRVKRHALNTFQRIMILIEPVKKTTKTQYTVNLVTLKDDKVTVGFMDTREPAEALGQAIADLTHLPLQVWDEHKWLNRDEPETENEEEADADA